MMVQLPLSTTRICNDKRTLAGVLLCPWNLSQRCHLPQVYTVKAIGGTFNDWNCMASGMTSDNIPHLWLRNLAKLKSTHFFAERCGQKSAWMVTALLQIKSQFLTL